MSKASNFVKAAGMALITLALTAALEAVKTALFPHLSLWQSHTITILYFAAVAFVLSLAILWRWRRDVASLRRERVNFEALVEHLPGLACIVDKNHKLMRWNSRFQTVLGYSAAELREMFAYEGIAEDYRDLVPAIIGRAWQTGYAEMEAAWLTKDGQRTPCYLTGVRILVGDQPCVLSVGIDISHQKHAEEALRKSEEQYRRLLTNLPDVAWTSGLSGQITYVSPNVQDVFGQTPQEICEGGVEGIIQRIHPDDRDFAVLSYRKLFEENEVFDAEYRFQRSDGVWRWVQDRAIRTHEQDGVLLADGVLTDITERKQAEEADSRLAAIVMSCGDAIIAETTEGTILSWNPGAEQMYGYTADEAIGQHVSRFISPERLHEVPDIISRILRGEPTQHFDSVGVRKDGTRFDVSVAVAAIKDKSGRVLGISGIAHDITLRKRAEETLRKSEEQYRRLLNNLPDVTWTSSLNGDSSFVSSNIEEIFGYTRQEFREQGAKLWFDHIHPRDRGRVQEKRKALFETGDVFNLEYRVQHKDCRWLWVCDRALRTHEQHGVPFADGILTDITERKAAEETTSQLASIVNSSSGAIIGKNADGTIVSWNPAAEKMFGYSTDEAIGKHISLLVPPERRHELPYVLGKIARGEQVERFDSVCLCKDGSRLDVALSISPIMDRNGAVLGISTIANDISLRKRAEQDLFRAKEAAEAAARAKTQFLANMSQELRTPMNSILGMAESALDTQLDAEQRESLLVIQSTGTGLLRLIDDLLDFTRTESGTLALDSIAFNLHETVRQTLRPLRFQAQQVGLEFVCHMDPGLPAVVFGDPQRLRQVLVNLVGNAIKFTYQGKVEVHVACASLTADTAEVLFTISDTGIGVSPDKHSTIFEGFTQGNGSSTRMNGGTGLGLAISSHLVALMNGKIWVESQHGHGSTFRFTVQLPVSENGRRRFPEPATTVS
jgi:PAS domain S-box-containing protein